MKKTLTVFTPTYNRKELLHKVYDSLVNQTSNDFEWVIVDDGSSDNTKEIVDSWINENKVSIRYYYQQNAGKMQAHNKGVEETNTELFVCLDSDDYFTNEAVEIIIKKWNEVKDNNEVIGLLNPRYAFNEIVEKNYNFPTSIATMATFYEKYHFSGDTVLVYKTELLRKYLFPKIDGEKFIKEDYIYDKLDKEGKLKFFNTRICLSEYLTEGYTKNIKRIIYNNPKGYVLWANQKMKLAITLKTRLSAAAKYTVGNMISKEKKYIRKANNKFLTFIMWPIGYLYYLKTYKNGVSK